MILFLREQTEYDQARVRRWWVGADIGKIGVESQERPFFRDADLCKVPIVGAAHALIQD